MSLFEQAVRAKFRFPSIKGLLTTEELWDLPLQSKSGFDLDNVARGINRDLKTTGSESFVAATSPAATMLETQLEVVKHIIAVRLAENKQATERTHRLAERQKLLDILADKHDESLKAMTPEEIQKRLAELEV